MKIKKVLCTTNNKLMNFDEVAKHPEHALIKHALQCATPGCNAKISFVSGKTSFFRTVAHSEHSEECDLKIKREELEERFEKTKTVAVSLDNKAIEQKIRYLYMKRRKSQSNDISTTPKNNSSKTKTLATIMRQGISTTLGDKNDPLLEEVKKDGRVSSPVIPTRELNQISGSDAGNMINLTASVQYVKETKNGFELGLFSGNSKAILVITEAFVKGSRDVQITDYFMSLKSFLDVPLKKRLPVAVYALCMFNEYKGNETIIFVNNFDMFFISVEGKRSAPMKMDSFQARFTRNSLE